MAPRDPLYIDMAHKFARPGEAGFLLGADELGRDVLSRLLHAGRVSLAVGLVTVMLVAIATVHWRNGFFLNWSLQPGKSHGLDMNLALIAMALAVLVGGAGAWSIDRLIGAWG